jgi:hypothetical protein
MTNSSAAASNVAFEGIEPKKSRVVVEGRKEGGK